MRKKAKELKRGDAIKAAGQKLKVENIEISEIGKQGKRKCRLELKNEKGEKVILIRPEDYPFEVI